MKHSTLSTEYITQSLDSLNQVRVKLALNQDLTSALCPVVADCSLFAK